MNRSFNLVDKPWIPVAGEVNRRSLMSIFTNNPKMLTGNPVDKIVIFRLLLSIVHASTKIYDMNDWKNLSKEQIAENARTYLTEHHDLFDIYNEEKPFLQFPQLKNKTPKFKPLHNKITVGYGDNKSLLTDKDHDETITDAEKAILLLRIICFNFGSKSFNKNVIFSSNYTKKATAKPGTLLGNAGYLHSYLKGENLWQSLYFNLLSEEDIKNLKGKSTVIGKPAWEEMPTGENDDRAKEFKKSYMGILLPLDKFVLFTEDNKIIKTDGIYYEEEADSNICIDPARTVINRKNKLTFFNVNPSKSVWRELEAILSFVNADNNQLIQPYFFSFGIKKLRSIDKNEVVFWVGGISVSNTSGEHSIKNNDNYVESEFKLSLLKLTLGLNKYKDNMYKLNRICKNLSNSVVNFFDNTNRKNSLDKNIIKNKIEEMFWESMELHKDIIIDISFNNIDIDTINSEQDSWKRISEEIFNEICPSISDNRFKEWIKTKNNLIKMNHKV